MRRGDASLLLGVPRRSLHHGILDQDIGVYDLQALRLRDGRHRGGLTGEGHARHRQANLNAGEVGQRRGNLRLREGEHGEVKHRGCERLVGVDVLEFRVGNRDDGVAVGVEFGLGLRLRLGGLDRVAILVQLGLGLGLGLDEELILLGVPLARAGQVVLGRASVQRGHLGRFLLDLLLRLGEREGEGQALDDEVRPLAPLLPRHLLAVGRLPEVGAPSRQPAQGQHQVLAEHAHVLRLRGLPGELRVGKVLSLRARGCFVRRSPLRGEGSLPSERSLVIRRAL